MKIFFNNSVKFKNRLLDDIKQLNVKYLKIKTKKAMMRKSIYRINEFMILIIRLDTDRPRYI